MRASRTAAEVVSSNRVLDGHIWPVAVDLTRKQFATAVPIFKVRRPSRLTLSSLLAITRDVIHILANWTAALKQPQGRSPPTERYVYTICYNMHVVDSGFEWDDNNILHIARHQFTPHEVEEVFDGVHKVRRSRQGLYSALGKTMDGRLAFVVFRRLSGGSVRVITAAIWTQVNAGNSVANCYLL